LADEQRQRALGDGWLAIAEFRGDIDLDGQAGETADTLAALGRVMVSPPSPR